MKTQVALMNNTYADWTYKNQMVKLLILIQNEER